MTSWTITCQAPLSMGFLKQEMLEWGVIPPPEDLPESGIEPMPPALQADSLSVEPLVKSHYLILWRPPVILINSYGQMSCPILSTFIFSQVLVQRSINSAINLELFMKFTLF